MAKTKSIGLALLAEYLTASAARRRSIIDDASDPKPYIATTYNRAASGMVREIAALGGGDSVVDTEIARLDRVIDRLEDSKERQNAVLSREALARYSAWAPRLVNASTTVHDPKIGPGQIAIGGMRVTLRPEAIITVERANVVHVGAVKFHYAKKALGKPRADYTAAVLRWYSEEHLSDFGIADHRTSRVFDIVSEIVYEAPKGRVRVRGEITAACEEIADRWPKS